MPGKRRILIAPSLLACDFTEIGEEISSIERAGADWLHLDVMDGRFVPPISFGEIVIASARKVSGLTLDTHLMIEEPHLHLESFRKAGSDRITIHLEAADNVDSTLTQIRKLGLGAGLSIKPGTPAEAVFPHLELCDLVLVMSVEPGWGGQHFMKESQAKIAALREEIDRRGSGTLIQVDGGINSETAKLCIEAGVDCIVAGTYVFHHPDRKEAIESLRA